MSIKRKAAKATMQSLDEIVQRLPKLGGRRDMKTMNDEFMKNPELYKAVFGRELPKKFHKK
jgi:hypothetical protein